MTALNVLRIRVNRSKMKSKFTYGDAWNQNAPIVRIFTKNGCIILDIVLEDENDISVLECCKRDMLVVFKYLVEYDVPFEYVV